MSAPSLPPNAPKEGEIFRHYKGNLYKVRGLALDSSDAWTVVYEPLYEGAVAPLFVRPLTGWNEIVEWEGKRVPRFDLVALQGRTL